MEIKDVVTSVRGQKVTVGDVLLQLKLKSAFRPAIYEIIENHVVKYKCEEFGLALSDADFKRKMDQKRMLMGLNDTIALNNYCKFNGISFDQWKEFVRHEVEKEMLRQYVTTNIITENLIVDIFQKRKEIFSTVCMGRIVCADADCVNQIVSAIKNGEDFPVLAGKYSMDKNTRFTGGFIGEVRRGMLAPEVEERAFSGKKDDIIGPFHENGIWTLYKIYAIHVAELSEHIRAILKGQLFVEWLKAEVAKAPV